MTVSGSRDGLPGSDFNPIYEETFDNSHELYKQMRHECPVATALLRRLSGRCSSSVRRRDRGLGDVHHVGEERRRRRPRNQVSAAAPLRPARARDVQAAVNLVFGAGRMTALTGRVRELADGLLDRLVAQGEFDYTKDFAESSRQAASA